MIRGKLGSSFVANIAIWFMIFPGVLVAESSHAPVTPVGEFSNMHVQNEHCSGYSIRLWKSGEKLYGIFLACNGLAGDTPTGLLDDVMWDSVSQHISWKAKLTLGSDVLESGAQVPSKDDFSFAGVFKGNVISGKLTAHDQADPDADVSTRSIRLPRGPNELDSFADYGAWKRATDALLKLRGPRW